MAFISIVVPVYNEMENLEHFCSEICKYMEPLPHDFELLFVDDGSQDATPAILDRLAHDNQRVRAILLARNFGHQTAITCGLDYADGDAVITMDGDMQHPPALLPLLISKWEEGFEVVQTIRKDTAGVSWFKKFTSALFYKLMNIMSNVRVQEGGSDFRLLDKRVVESFRKFRERARFIRGMIGAIGYRQVQVEFVAPPRHAGQSKFSVHKMLHFALDGITSYSNVPLRFAFYAGFILALFSFGIVVHVLYIRWFTDAAVPGWATTSASISLLGGMQFLGLGIIGEYVGRIFEEVKQRPLYLIRTEINKRSNDDG